MIQIRQVTPQQAQEPKEPTGSRHEAALRAVATRQRHIGQGWSPKGGGSLIDRFAGTGTRSIGFRS